MKRSIIPSTCFRIAVYTTKVIVYHPQVIYTQQYNHCDLEDSFSDTVSAYQFLFPSHHVQYLSIIYKCEICVLCAITTLEIGDVRYLVTLPHYNLKTTKTGSGVRGIKLYWRWHVKKCALEFTLASKHFRSWCIPNWAILIRRLGSSVCLQNSWGELLPNRIPVPLQSGNKNVDAWYLGERAYNHCPQSAGFLRSTKSHVHYYWYTWMCVAALLNMRWPELCVLSRACMSP